jgi:hypothetical protein
MAKFDYTKGFICPIHIVPVVRDPVDAHQRIVVHARASQSFSFGHFNCPEGELLCRSRNGNACHQIEGTVVQVSCTACRKLLDRWSRDAIDSRCVGFSFERDLITRAVAAKSTLFASELLGVNNNWLKRNGVIKIDLSSARFGDGLDPIRVALKKHPYGTVIEKVESSRTWGVITPAQDAEKSLLERKIGESIRGNTRVTEMRQNHTLKLTKDEKTELQKLGGSKWIRAQIANPPQMVVAMDLVSDPKDQTTLRATDAEWDALLALGGAPWLRTVIRSVSAG